MIKKILTYVLVVVTLAGCFVLVKYVDSQNDVNYAYPVIKLEPSVVDTEDITVSSYQKETPEYIKKYEEDMKMALQDDKWALLVNSYQKSCDPEGVQWGISPERSFTFRELVEKVEVSDVLEDGTEIYILPCWLAAYQAGQMPVVYDGIKYIPLLVPYFRVDEGVIYEEYSVPNLYYNKETKTFYSHAAGRGIGDCWSEGEYVYLNKSLVLMKYTVDDECDEVYSEGEVIYSNTII